MTVGSSARKPRPAGSTSDQVRSFHTSTAHGLARLASSSPNLGSPGRSFSTKNQPASSGPPTASSRGEVEAEQVDVRLDLRLVARQADLVRGRRTGDDDQAARLGLVGQPVVAGRPFGAVRVDGRRRVLLQQLAADHEDDPLPRPVRVVAQAVRGRPGVDRRDVVAALPAQFRRLTQPGSAVSGSQNWRNGVPRWSVGNSRQSSSRAISWLSPAMNDSMNSRLFSSSVNRVRRQQRSGSARTCRPTGPATAGTSAGRTPGRPSPR